MGVNHQVEYVSDHFTNVKYSMDFHQTVWKIVLVKNAPMQMISALSIKNVQIFHQLPYKFANNFLNIVYLAVTVVNQFLLVINMKVRIHVK